jgi:two-component system, chemotaxis family, chemotaxis protein CheY
MSTGRENETMPRTLLVADDAMIIRKIIKDLAGDAGWTVVGEAGNGREAVDRYCQLRPDAVTLDLVMPEQDGLYALHRIMEFDPQAKVLVVSALDQRGVLKEAFKAGAADFVPKPFDRKELKSTLDRLHPESRT